MTDKQYLDNKIKKQEIYKTHGLDLINIEIAESRKMDKVLREKLGQFISTS